MSDLVEFIRARIAEDRTAAEAATQGPWETVAFGGRDGSGGEWWSEYGVMTAAGSPVVQLGDTEQDESDVAHIARQDPTATLARCGALDPLVGLHAPVPRDYGAPWCMNDGHDFPCPTLRTLAAIWSSHTDYRQEWRP